jgi:hypothetical protein
VLLLSEDVPRRFDMAPLPRENMEFALRSILDDEQWDSLKESGAVEFSHVPDVGRQVFWVKLLNHRGKLRLEAYLL